jgi:hypothetical protein
MLKTLLNNFTHNEIQAEIQPTNAEGKILNLIFYPRDKKAFNHYDQEYTVSVKRINSKPVNLNYRLKFSSYVAFMSDIDSDRLYLKDFLNKNVYENCNPSLAVPRNSYINQNYNFTTTTNSGNANNSSALIFETTTNSTNSNPIVKETYFTTTSNLQNTPYTNNSYTGVRESKYITTTNNFQNTTYTTNKNTTNTIIQNTTNTNNSYTYPVMRETYTSTNNNLQNSTNTTNSNPGLNEININTSNNLQRTVSKRENVFVEKDFLKVEINEENDIFAKKPLSFQNPFSKIIGKNNTELNVSKIGDFADNIIQIEKRKILPNEILISNFSSFHIYVRLSGMKNSENFISIPSGFNKIFQRKNNSIYKLNICYNKGTVGPVYNLRTNMEYSYDQSGNLSDINGKNMLSLVSTYEPKFERENCIEFLNNSSDSRGSIPKRNNIIVTNKTEGNIYASIQGSTYFEFEDLIEIYPNCLIRFPRNTDDKPFDLKIVHSDGSNTFHSVLNNRCYEISGKDQILVDLLSGSKVEKNTSSITSIKNPFSFKNGLINFKSFHKKEVNLEFWSPKWLELREEILAHPNKKRLKEIRKIFLCPIKIKNNTKTIYYLRVQCRNQGSQQFLKIAPNESFTWTRGEGLYLTELVNFETLRSKRYKLMVDNDYIIFSDERLSAIKYSNDGKEEYEDMKNVGEYFERAEYLNYYDEEKKEYINKKINHKNFNKQFSKIITPHKTEEEKEENIEYFNDFKPNYTPGTIFVDTEFPPDETSFRATDKSGKRRIPHFPHGKSILDEKKIKSLTFKRPREVFSDQYHLFKDEIDMNDCKQGNLGNCYLISVLASLTLRPDLIYNVFKAREINPDGFYELYYYENSKKKVMYIDDNCVVYNSKYVTDFQFAKPNGSELWVMLLEKAYAKYEGGYSNIIGGVMHCELTWLTGAVTRKILTKDPNAWNELISASKKSYIINSSSNAGTGNHNNKTPNGISNGHAYSIIGVNEYHSKNEDIRLLRMRNPWGNTEWKGKYSDNCPLWTPELKEFFQYDKYIGKSGTENDGIFFIPFEEYLKEFSSFIICCINSGNEL